MHRAVAASLAGLLALSAATVSLAQQQPDPQSPRAMGVAALEEFLDSTGDEAVESFARDKIAVSVRESMEPQALRDALSGLRDDSLDGERRGALPAGELAAEIVFDMDDGGSYSIEFRLDPADPGRFVFLRSPMRTIGG